MITAVRQLYASTVLTDNQGNYHFKMSIIFSLILLKYYMLLHICGSYQLYSKRRHTLHTQNMTHMYPAQCDEVVLVLHQKQLLFILCVTVIWTSTLLRHNHVCHRECVPVLQQAHKHSPVRCLKALHW